MGWELSSLTTCSKLNSAFTFHFLHWFEKKTDQEQDRRLVLWNRFSAEREQRWRITQIYVYHTIRHTHHPGSVSRLCWGWVQSRWLNWLWTLKTLTPGVNTDITFHPGDQWKYLGTVYEFRIVFCCKTKRPGGWAGPEPTPPLTLTLNLNPQDTLLPYMDQHTRPVGRCLHPLGLLPWLHPARFIPRGMIYLLYWRIFHSC